MSQRRHVARRGGEGEAGVHRDEGGENEGLDTVVGAKDMGIELGSDKGEAQGGARLEEG